MNAQSRKSKHRNTWTDDHELAVHLLAAAVERVKGADPATSREQLRPVVDAARDAGVGWTKIGDTIGIASGNAYQRYRKRPDS